MLSFRKKVMSQSRENLPAAGRADRRTDLSSRIYQFHINGNKIIRHAILRVWFLPSWAHFPHSTFSPQPGSHRFFHSPPTTKVLHSKHQVYSLIFLGGRHHDRPFKCFRWVFPLSKSTSHFLAQYSMSQANSSCCPNQMPDYTYKECSIISIDSNVTDNIIRKVINVVEKV